MEVSATALERLRGWMREQGYDRFWVYRPENFAWLTGGGDNTVVVGEGVAWLEVEPDQLVVHTSTIEAERLVEEEVPGFKVQAYPWYTLPSLPLQYPNDLEQDLTSLRLILSSEEQERFRRLGRDAATAVGEVLQACTPEQTERELAGSVAEALRVRGIQPVVLLAAGEERAWRYRHPLPQDRRLGRLALVVVCGRRAGLVVNLTRMRSWGAPEARERYHKILAVEAQALDASRVGVPLSEVLEAIRKAYEKIGYPEALLEHHQGGVAGYRPREVLAIPGESTVLQPGMALAWNPSLPGAKVEDTFLLTTDGLELLTQDPNWPSLLVKGRLRPDLLEG